MIERAVVDGSSSCSDQNFCCTTASRLKRPQTPTRAARRARATSPGPMLRAAAVAATTAPRAIAPRARRGRGVPATRRTRVFARAGGDDDADDDADARGEVGRGEVRHGRQNRRRAGREHERNELRARRISVDVVSHRVVRVRAAAADGVLIECIRIARVVDTEDTVHCDKDARDAPRLFIGARMG